MKLLLSSDWHWARQIPEKRIDDYHLAMETKIATIFRAAKDNDADILHGGDLTDSPFLSYADYIILLTELEKNKKGLYVAYGQHDLKHRNAGNTPLDALAKSLVSLHILTNRKDPIGLGENIFVYGASFGEFVPRIITKGFNILIIHKTIYKRHDFEWQKKYELADSLLRNTKFDLIVSGDNHQTFTMEYEGRLLVNPGSLMRSKIDQIEHRPSFFLFDSVKKELLQIPLPIAPSEEVFDLEEKFIETKRSESMEAFISSLPGVKVEGLQVEDNLLLYMEENKIEQEIRDIILDCR